MVQSDTIVDVPLAGSFAPCPPGGRAHLESVINEQRIEHRVQWEGRASFGRALFGQLDRPDVFLPPTMSEGNPWALLEVPAPCLPIVATRVGSIPSSVMGGHDGLLVRPKDVRALAEAMSRIITGATLRKRLIHQGRERVAWLIVQRLVDLVLELLTDRTPVTRQTGFERAAAGSVMTRSPWDAFIQCNW
jgi:glycosyltransferase involved in cell wall biosynthesis